MLKKKQMLTLTEWYDEDCFTCFEGEPDDPTGSKAMEQHVRVISHGGKNPRVHECHFTRRETPFQTRDCVFTIRLGLEMANAESVRGDEVLGL